MTIDNLLMFIQNILNKIQLYFFLNSWLPTGWIFPKGDLKLFLFGVS